MRLTEEMHFEIEHFHNFFTYDRVIQIPLCSTHGPLPTQQISFKSGKTFCGGMDRHMDTATGFIRSTRQLGQVLRVSVMTIWLTSLTFSRSSFGLLPWGANLLASTFGVVALEWGRPPSNTHYTQHITHSSILDTGHLRYIQVLRISSHNHTSDTTKRNSDITLHYRVALTSSRHRQSHSNQQQ